MTRSSVITNRLSITMTGLIIDYRLASLTNNNVWLLSSHNDFVKVMLDPDSLLSVANSGFLIVIIFKLLMDYISRLMFSLPVCS